MLPAFFMPVPKPNPTPNSEETGWTICLLKWYPMHLVSYIVQNLLYLILLIAVKNSSITLFNAAGQTESFNTIISSIISIQKLKSF